MPFKRSIFALVTAILLTFALAAVASAQWPTTCVEANDAFERYVGNHHNVGIYQRTFGYGYEAEQACQRDHGRDIRAAFNWAFPGQSYSPPADTSVEIPPHWAPPAFYTAFVADEGNRFSFYFTIPNDGRPGALPILGIRFTIIGATQFREETQTLERGEEPPIGVSYYKSDFNPGMHVFVIRAFNSAGDGLPTYRKFNVTHRQGLGA